MKLRDSRGFVLPAALACIVLIALMATAGLFATTQEAWATRAAILDLQATGYAERSAMLAIEEWSCELCDSMTVGGVITLAPPADPPLESSVFITRLDTALYLVVGEGRVKGAGGTRLARRVSITVRITRDSLGRVRTSPLHPHSWAAVFGM